MENKPVADVSPWQSIAPEYFGIESNSQAVVMTYYSPVDSTPLASFEFKCAGRGEFPIEAFGAFVENFSARANNYFASLRSGEQEEALGVVVALNNMMNRALEEAGVSNRDVKLEGKVLEEKPELWIPAPSDDPRELSIDELRYPATED